MTRSAAEIERDVEQTRAGLDETVEALKSKMSPGQLIDELTQSLKGSGAGDIFGTLGHQVKDNPLALSLIGAGIAWLMVGKGGGVPPPAFTSGAGVGAPSSADSGAHTSGVEKAASAVGEMKERALDVVHTAVSGAGDAASHLKDSFGASTEGALGAAQIAGRGALNLSHRAQRTFMDILEQEPFIFGALGVALGATIGASLPATRMEDKAFGGTRDRVADQAKTFASDGVDQAKSVAGAALDGARDAAQKAGFIGDDDGSLADKAETVIRAGIESGKENAASHSH